MDLTDKASIFSVSTLLPTKKKNALMLFESHFKKGFNLMQNGYLSNDHLLSYHSPSLNSKSDYLKHKPIISSHSLPLPTLVLAHCTPCPGLLILCLTNPRHQKEQRTQVKMRIDFPPFNRLDLLLRDSHSATRIQSTCLTE